MSGSSYAHTNPFNQGGWNPENSWPNDGSFVPGTPASASWTPAQTGYGVLPIAASPGTLPPGLIDETVTFRFMASGDQTHLVFVGPNYRACYHIRTDNTHSYIQVPRGQLARISWTGSEPVLECGGRTQRASEFMCEALDEQGRRLKIVLIEGREYAWTYDERGYYIHLKSNMDEKLGFVYNRHGVEVKMVRKGLSTEMLNCVLLGVIMMQGKMFVGIH